MELVETTPIVGHLDWPADEGMSLTPSDMTRSLLPGKGSPSPSSSD
jgi:hypothetical protein